MPKRKRQIEANFQHSRLHLLRSIRLLRLNPSPELSASLDVSLFEVSLGDFPSDTTCYEALSYVWGASTGSVPCTCDGKQLLITANCDEALRHIRLPNKPRNLWVDAICIDQGGSEESQNERNTQITLMGEVYRNAKHTLCWLGKGEEYSAETFKLLRRIGSCPSKRELQRLLAYDRKLREKGKLETEASCLNHIFCHSWHSRIWTVQEVAFSRECQIICGAETIPWNLYFAAARFLIYDESIDDLDPQAWKNYMSLLIRNDLCDSINSMLSGRGGVKPMVLLTSDLTQVRHLQATNPKDKIYGLYAVFAALSIPLPAPDYAKPLEKIYEEACIAIILHSGSLAILQYACSNARAQNLPSWVADWQDEDVTLMSLPTQATEGSRIAQTDLSTLSQASGQLRVRGRLIGLITARAENDFATIDFPAYSFPILRQENYELVGSETDSLRMLVHTVRLFREWLRLTDEVPPPYSNKDSGHSFHKLVTLDSDYSDAGLFNAWIDLLQYPETSYDLSNGERMVEKWKRVDVANGCHWTAELSHCATVAAALLTKSAVKDGRISFECSEMSDLTAHLSGNMGNRTLILVHDRLLDATLPGTAFHTAMVGDSVFLLEGSESPIVLRPKGDKWSFVGPAFVVGIMEGEAWLDEDDTDQDLEHLVLI